MTTNDTPPTTEPVIWYGYAASPQPSPSPMPEGATPIAELVIADIRARAEVGVRKYGTPLHAHNGRRALMDLYQELLDAAQYTRQVLEEDYEGRALWAEATLGEVRKALGCVEGDDVEAAAQRLRASADHFRQQYEAEEEAGRMLAARSEVANRLRLVMEALWWDESKGDPIKWARAVVFAWNEAQALIARRAEEVGGLRAQADDLAAKVVKLSNRVEEDKRDLAAVVAERDAAVAAGRDFERLRCEAAALRADLAEVTAVLGWSRHLGVDRGEWARSIVMRMGERAAEAESLKAGLRALAIARDEGAAETHRWRDRAFAAEAKVTSLKDEERNADKLVDDLGRARWDAKCAEDNAAKAWAIRGEAVERLGEWVEIARKLEEERDALFVAGLGIEAERAALVAEVEALKAGAIGKDMRASLESEIAALRADLARAEKAAAEHAEPDPGEGWRLLEDGEEVGGEDEVWRPAAWAEVEPRAGHRIESGDRVRRRIDPRDIVVGPDHVRLTPGEAKQLGDEWTSPEHWARKGPQSWIPCALIGIPVPSTSEVVRRRRE